MTHQIATTPSQSARLLACGVDPNMADMLLYNNALSVQVRGLGKIPECATPAWSLSALLELLPKHLDDFPQTKWRPPFWEDEIWEMDNEGVLNGDVKLYSNGTNWIVDYDWDGFSGTLPQSENPIEAVVLAITATSSTRNNYETN